MNWHSGQHRLLPVPLESKFLMTEYSPKWGILSPYKPSNRGHSNKGSELLQKWEFPKWKDLFPLPKAAWMITKCKGLLVPHASHCSIRGRDESIRTPLLMSCIVKQQLEPRLQRTKSFTWSLRNCSLGDTDLGKTKKVFWRTERVKGL